MDKKTQKKLLTLVKKNYNNIAGEFNQTRKKKIWPILLELTQNIKNGDKILDAGCGNGRIIDTFRGKDIDYIGFDSNNKLIKLAKENFPDRKFKVLDILNSNKLNENGFDYIFSIAVLHHIPGNNLRIKVLKDLKNKLSDDGKIIITVWNLWEFKKFKNKIFYFALLKLILKNKMEFGDILFDWHGKSINNKNNKRYYHVFTTKGLKKLAKKSGLAIKMLKKDQFNYYLILKKK